MEVDGRTASPTDRSTDLDRPIGMNLSFDGCFKQDEFKHEGTKQPESNIDDMILGRYQRFWAVWNLGQNNKKIFSFINKNETPYVH